MISRFAILFVTYFSLSYIIHTDYITYHYGNKNQIIKRFELAEKNHVVYSGQDILNMAKAMQSNPFLTTLTKLELARELIYQQIIVNNDTMDVLDTNKLLFTAKTPEQAFLTIVNTMNRINKGVKCAGTATILSLLYRIMGYQTWLYTYGSLDSNSRLTHTLTLVEANQKIYLEDAYFNYSYVDENHIVLPFEQVLIRNKNQTKVYTQEGELNLKRLIQAMNSTLSENCKAIEIDQTTPDYQKQNNIYWARYKTNILDCFIKESNNLNEAKDIVLKDYPVLNLTYLVNYPVWLTDMQTLTYYPMAKYKEHKLFFNLAQKSNRYIFISPN